MKLRFYFDAFSALILGWTALASVPITWFWFKPEHLFIADATVGQTPHIAFEREIMRPVFMSYAVVVRQLPGLAVVCEGGNGPFTYRPDVEFKPDADLVWWAAGDERCASLPVGSYVVETCWTMPLQLFPDKSVCVEGAFNILAPPVQIQLSR